MILTMAPGVIRRTLLLAALLIATLSARLAFAGALSFESLVDTQLMPSKAPALLGPITESGRAGWKCLPEVTAEARGWREAELPNTSTP